MEKELYTFMGIIALLSVAVTIFRIKEHKKREGK